MARCDRTLYDPSKCRVTPTETAEQCGVVASTIVVPELEIQTRNFIVDSAVNKYGVPFPPELPEICFPEGSFITMLFDECYDLDYYKHLYEPVEDKLSWPSVVTRRLNVYPISGRYMELDDINGSNVFSLQTDDFSLLDALLVYRQDSTGLVVIDTTADTGTTLVYDSTADVTILTTSLVALSTELSKLIFVYLVLVVNKNTSNYSSNIPISTDYALQTIYELFVIDKYFSYMSCMAVDVRLGAMDPDYAGQPYDPSAGPPGSNPPGGEGSCVPEVIEPNPSILQYPPNGKC